MFMASPSLLTRFEARPPAEGHDDVAELAGEWTPPGDLQASEHVAIDLQQVDPRRRQFGNVRLLALLVPALMATLFPVL